MSSRCNLENNIRFNIPHSSFCKHYSSYPYLYVGFYISELEWMMGYVFHVASDIVVISLELDEIRFIVNSVD